MTFQQILIVFAFVTTLTCVGLVAVAFIWMKKLRQNVLDAMEQMAKRHNELALQARTAMELLQKRQAAHDRRLSALAEGHLRMESDLLALSTRLEESERQLLGTTERRVLH